MISLLNLSGERTKLVCVEFLSEEGLSGETVKQSVEGTFVSGSFKFSNSAVKLQMTTWYLLRFLYCLSGDACRDLQYTTCVHVAFSSITLLFHLDERMSDFMTQDATLFLKAL